MAKSAGSFTGAFALLCLCFLLLSPSEVMMAEGKLCSRYSRTWSGICVWSKNCNKQCRNWEGARYGACHHDKHGRACFCYFRC